MLPELLHVSKFEVINRELQLFLQANITVGDGCASVRIDSPDDVINRVHVLQKRCDAFQAIGKLRADGIEIEAAALLEVGELSNLQSVEHDLPPYAPRAAGGPLPVVFFELEVVLS